MEFAVGIQLIYVKHLKQCLAHCIYYVRDSYYYYNVKE